MFTRLKRFFSASQREARLQEQLEQLRQHLPLPVFWLFGKTQSGKTTLIKYLTGADEAEVGKGFRPCTRFSREYLFPTADAPLLDFLDTRGLDEPGYDPAEDLARFDERAHVVLVTVKVLDHAQENVLNHLRTIRRARPSRPVVLVLTCLHEAYPQQQHPLPYPFADLDALSPPSADGTSGSGFQPDEASGSGFQPDLREGAEASSLPADLLRSIAEQRRRFGGLVDRTVAVDLTPPEEGFNDATYGGLRLRQVLLDVLPAALRQTLITLDESRRDLQDFYSRQALPCITGYSSLAASAGAVPIPFVDLVLISGIQSQMVYHLARLYGQPLTGQRFLEVATTLGLGMLVRQTTRSLIKFIPFIGSVIGSVANAALAFGSTFALGKAFCYYYQAVLQGHVPHPDDLRRYYKEQLSLAEQAWKDAHPKKTSTGST